MRQPQNAKRGRGRGRRGNGNSNNNQLPNRNTSYESNGPDVKLRGNAKQLCDKYLALAHDAATSGERISAEAYTQFSDHYFRLHQAAVGIAETRRQQEQNVNSGPRAEGEAQKNKTANPDSESDVPSPRAKNSDGKPLFSGRKDGVHNDETSDPVESEPKGLEAVDLAEPAGDAS